MKSGNGNNWSSGGGNLNNTLDNPSDNFCTWNGNSKIDNGSTSYGLLRITGSDSGAYSKSGVGSIGVQKENIIAKLNIHLQTLIQILV